MAIDSDAARSVSPKGRSSAPPLPRLLDIKDLAEHLGVTPRHIRRLVAERRVPFIKWGHLIRFDPEEVGAWLETARVPPAARPRRPA